MKKFVVFEGIDGCGKTTLSKLVAEKLGSDWEWTHEPTFESEKADLLNKKSSNDRETEFAIDRIMHVINMKVSSKNFICDRYIWTGLTYCLMYNVTSYGFIKEFYRHKFFPKPQLTFFVDTPVNVCYDRSKSRTGESPQSLEALNKLRQSYLYTHDIISETSKIIIISSSTGLEKLAQTVVDEINKIQD